MYRRRKENTVHGIKQFKPKFCETNDILGILALVKSKYFFECGTQSEPGQENEIESMLFYFVNCVHMYIVHLKEMVVDYANILLETTQTKPTFNSYVFG